MNLFKKQTSINIFFTLFKPKIRYRYSYCMYVLFVCFKTVILSIPYCTVLFWRGWNLVEVRRQKKNVSHLILEFFFTRTVVRTACLECSVPKTCGAYNSVNIRNFYKIWNVTHCLSIWSSAWRRYFFWFDGYLLSYRRYKKHCLCNFFELF